MQKSQIISTIQETLSYLYKRRESVFDEIQYYEQTSENLTIEIKSKETEIENQTTKQNQENNIFNLYNTSQSFVEKKNRLTTILEKAQTEQTKIQELLSKKRQELELINQNIISNQLVLRHFTETTDHQPEPSDSPIISTTQNITATSIKDFASRLELIFQLIDLDQPRCKLELQKLIDETNQK